MFFSPFAYIGLEGALHKSLLKLLIFPFKGLSGMGGKGRGWGQDGSNPPNPPFEGPIGVDNHLQSFRIRPIFALYPQIFPSVARN
jgi:hypothetical protein